MLRSKASVEGGARLPDGPGTIHYLCDGFGINLTGQLPDSRRTLQAREPPATAHSRFCLPWSDDKSRKSVV